MDEAFVVSIAQTLATNLRVARRARGWRQQDLADRCGVSKGMIQQIETMQTNPSILTLARLSEALATPIGALVEPPHGVGSVARADDVAPRRCGRRGRSQAWLMVNDGRTPPSELWRFALASGDEVRSSGHPHGTRELIAVTDGRLAVEVGPSTFMLDSDDCLVMRGDLVHAYRNPGGTPVRFLMTVLYAGEQDPRYVATPANPRQTS